jgi:putative ABC transport system permease protein
VGLREDLRHGLRSLRRRPGLSLLIVVTLALGIGAASTVLGLAEAVLVRALPFHSPERLVVIGEVLKSSPGEQRVSSYPNYLDWKARNHVFESMAVSRPTSPTLRLPAEPVRVLGAEVSQEFFPLLGLRTELGRPLAPGDFRPGATPVAVLSHRLWQQRFGGDRREVGRTVSLDEKPVTIIGVLPAGTPLDEPVVIGPADLLQPLVVPANDPFSGRGVRYMRVLARLREGVPVEQAAAEMESLATALAAEYPKTNLDAGVRVESLREVAVASSRPALLGLLGGAALLLLIACANAANILLVQLSARRKDLAVRSALGADRTRLFRQLALESVPLGVLAFLLGLLLTVWAWDTFAALLPASIVHLTGLAIDGRVVAATALVSLLTLVLVDLLPFLELSRLPLRPLLAGDSAGAGESGSSRRLRDVLVAGELALSLALLIGAGLLVRSLLRLSRVDLGLRPERVLAFHLDLPGYDEPARVRQLLAGLAARLEGRPGVRSAAVVVNLPLKEGANMSTGVGLRPQEWLDWRIDLNSVSPGYFSTLGIPLLAGRDFSPREMEGQPSVVILNAMAANRLWPGENALGKRVVLDFMSPDPREVVGVVGDVREASPEAPPHPEAYLPYPQTFFGSANVVVHTAIDPLRVAGDVRRQVHALDASLPISDMTTLDQLVAGKTATPLTDARILSSFAFVGVVLATIGVYGVTSFVVSQRRREAGIRIAFGAQDRDVVRAFVAPNVRWIVLGLLLGLGGGYLLSRLLASTLFEISPLDPWTFAAMPLLLMAVALWASWLPARKAAAVDPVQALAEG